MRCEFQKGQQVLLYNSRLRLFLGKLRSRCSCSYIITKVFPYGVVEVRPNHNRKFKVNGQRQKAYSGKEVIGIPQRRIFMILSDSAIKHVHLMT